MRRNRGRRKRGIIKEKRQGKEDEGIKESNAEEKKVNRRWLEDEEEEKEDRRKRASR